jgi:hypothetical protein
MSALEMDSPHSTAGWSLSTRRSPQALRPEIARIIEELARAAVRREDRRARELAIENAKRGGAEP